MVAEIHAIHNNKMSKYKNPPVFNSASKPYNRNIEELNAWCVITDVVEEKKAVAVALSFPEDDPSGVRDKIFNELKLKELNRADGMTKLKTYLIKLFQKDELTEVYERYIQFARYERGENTKMDAFYFNLKSCTIE